MLSQVSAGHKYSAEAGTEAADLFSPAIKRGCSMGEDALHMCWVLSLQRCMSYTVKDTALTPVAARSDVGRVLAHLRRLRNAAQA